jgi:hypothetical protein
MSRCANRAQRRRRQAEARAFAKAHRGRIAPAGSSYPTQPTEAVAAARRALGERAAVPADQFEIPPGLLGVTIDVEDAPPWTLMFDLAYVARIEAEAAAQATRVGLKYHVAVRVFAEDFACARQRGDDHKLRVVGIGILWSCFAHPQVGERLRRAVSVMMRRGERVHITWRFSKRARYRPGREVPRYGEARRGGAARRGDDL